jgi:hypothetical protein
MNEKVDLVEREVEGGFVDLGDAAEETKQIAPALHSPDSIYGWGYPTRAPL